MRQPAHRPDPPPPPWPPSIPRNHSVRASHHSTKEKALLEPRSTCQGPHARACKLFCSAARQAGALQGLPFHSKPKSPPSQRIAAQYLFGAWDCPPAHVPLCCKFKRCAISSGVACNRPRPATPEYVICTGKQQQPAELAAISGSQRLGWCARRSAPPPHAGHTTQAARSARFSNGLSEGQGGEHHTAQSTGVHSLSLSGEGGAAGLQPAKNQKKTPPSDGLEHSVRPCIREGRPVYGARRVACAPPSASQAAAFSWMDTPSALRRSQGAGCAGWPRIVRSGCLAGMRSAATSCRTGILRPPVS